MVAIERLGGTPSQTACHKLREEWCEYAAEEKERKASLREPPRGRQVPVWQGNFTWMNLVLPRLLILCLSPRVVWTGEFDRIPMRKSVVM